MQQLRKKMSEFLQVQGGHLGQGVAEPQVRWMHPLCMPRQWEMSSRCQEWPLVAMQSRPLSNQGGHLSGCQEHLLASQGRLRLRQSNQGDHLSE